MIGTMIKICVLTFLLFAPQQVQHPTVVNISANTRYDASYILGYTQKIIPINEEVCNEQIDCLVSELKATGMFLKVEAKLIPTGYGEQYYWLEVDTIYDPQIESFVIDEIELEGFPQIDYNKFNQLLSKKGIKTGTKFLKYNISTIRDKIISTIGVIDPKHFKEDPFASTWLTLKTDDNGKVKIIVSSFVPNFCSQNKKSKP